LILLSTYKDVFGITVVPKPKGYLQGPQDLEFPFPLNFVSKWSTDVLLSCLLDSFDKIRLIAFDLLKGFLSFFYLPSSFLFLFLFIILF